MKTLGLLALFFSGAGIPILVLYFIVCVFIQLLGKDL